MTDPRYDPRFQRGWDGRIEPPAPAETPSADTAVSSAPDALAASAPGADEAVDETWFASPRRNPFRIALAVLGVALLATGAGMAWFMVQGQSQPSTPWDTMLAQLPYELMPTMVLAGVVAIIAAIAVGGRPR